MRVRQRLSDDHNAVNELLKELLAALKNGDVELTYSRLDLLWARLAVHIRAEHLHLFPAVAARVDGAESIIENLRTDHDFFMRELARAIGILRELPRPLESPGSDARFSAVVETVRQVEKRLALHNEAEENQIYRWTTEILTEAEQLELATRINAELEKRPPRFSAEAWAIQ